MKLSLPIHILTGMVFSCCAQSFCLGDSIALPGFGRPLIVDDVLIGFRTYKREVIGIKRETGEFLWRFGTSRPPFRLLEAGKDSVAAVQFDTISILDAQTGLRKATLHVDGFTFGVSSDRSVYCWNTNGAITSYDLLSGKELWRTTYGGENSNILYPQHAGNLILLASTAREGISTSGLGGAIRVSPVKNEIACLNATDGSELWNERISLSEGNQWLIHFVSNDESRTIWCTPNCLRILDSQTGEILLRWDSPFDISSATFWKEDRIVVYLGGIGAESQLLHIISVPEFDTVKRYTVNQTGVSRIETVSDVLLVSRLDQSVGVDLRNGITLWEKKGRRFAPYQGSLYFGGYHGGMNVLGVCDPTTGNEKVLYESSSKN